MLENEVFPISANGTYWKKVVKCVSMDGTIALLKSRLRAVPPTAPRLEWSAGALTLSFTVPLFVQYIFTSSVIL